MKQTVLALSTMAALIATPIAAADAKTINNGAGAPAAPYADAQGDDYYDSGCHTVVSHRYSPELGETVTDSRRVCY